MNPRWSDLSPRLGRRAEMNELRQEVADIVADTRDKVAAYVDREARRVQQARQAQAERERVARARRRRMGG